MKSPALFFVLIMFAMNAFAEDIRFYIGTYTGKTNSKGIYTSVLDTKTGKLGPVTLAATTNNPGYLALNPAGKVLYAAAESGTDSAVSAFRVEDDGLLALLNQLPAGSGACHVWCDNTGGNVLEASYSEGSIACYRTKADGSLDSRTAFIQYTGSGPDAKRQASPHAHSAYTDAANRFVYSCDLGTDHVWIFKFDVKQGTLTPADPPSAMVPPGAGPRHIAMHPNGRIIYVNNEMGLSVTAFARDPDTGALTQLQTISTLPPGTPAIRASSAEIFLHPSGKWLYVSTRAHDVLTVFGVGADGRLKWLDETPAQVQIPRGFAIDPSGRWLIAAGQKDNRIAVLKIDQETGKLTPTDQTAEVNAPACIVFAPAH